MAMTETPKGEVWKITVTATYAERWLSGLKKLCRIMRLHTLTLPEEKTLFVCGGESSATVRCLASLAARFPKELRIRRFDPPKKMHLQFEWEKPSFFSWHGGLALETVRKSIMHSPDIDPLARFFRAAMEETDRFFCGVLTAQEQHQLRDMLARLIGNLENEVQHS